MSEYNLIDEKWIPVRDLKGKRRELGILETLTTADKLAAIEDPSPLVTAALYRFLLALLYRAIEGPCDIDEAKLLFREGLPKQKIAAYLEKWRNRFFLFDEKYPFGQNLYIGEDKSDAWTKITAEFNASSNKVLFDHTDTNNPGERTPQECARWLLAIMSFSVSGGRGYHPSPSPNAVICLPIGDHIQETLLYALVPQNKILFKKDLPVWERKPQKLPPQESKRMANGYADYYTWPARFVLLKKTSTNNISFINFTAGIEFDKNSMVRDPMQAFRIDESKGLLPIQFKERGFWRDFHSLLPDSEGIEPKVIDNAIGLTKKNRAQEHCAVLVMGLKNEPPSANLEYWRIERFTLPDAIINDHSIRINIYNLLEVAENTGKELWSACYQTGRELMSHGERVPDKNDIKSYIAQLVALPHYWSVLEAKFHEMLRDYSIDRHYEDIRHDWLVAIRNALSAAWNLHQHSIYGDNAWGIRALVKAEIIIREKIAELNNKINILKPEEVS